MQAQLIKCPNCGHDFELTETLALPLVETVRADLGAKLQIAQRDARQAKTQLIKERAELETARANLEAEVAERLAAKRPELEAHIRNAVGAEMAADVKATERENAVLRKSLAEAQEAQLAAIKAQQEIERKAASIDLEITKKVAAEATTIREQAVKDAQEAARLKLIEKDLVIKQLSEKAEELKRKAEQGSQRDQGEAAEIELQDALTSAFPWDEISEIKTGARGADVLQRVKTGAGAVAGSILWERKRAQGWSGEWLPKAKQDMRREKADAVVIVSDVVRKGVEFFDCCEDVWVVSPRCAVPVAKALRAGLLETASARRAAEGRKSNAERAYDYLMGPEFVQRLRGIAEPFRQMQSDLEAERRTMSQRWARRQKQIDRVLEAAFGMRGDIEALAGSDLPGLTAIETRALEATGGDGEVVE